MIYLIRVNIQNIERTHKTQYKNSKNSIKIWVENLKRHSSKEDIQRANTHIKKCSTSLIVRETQIKNRVRYYFTAVRVPTTQKCTNNKSGEDVEKTCPRALFVKM